MATYFVSRHPGTIERARQHGFPVDYQLAHLDISRIEAGDKIIGTLPVNHAAGVCAAGGRYFHLSLELPAEKRGQELTAEEIRCYGAKIEEYHIEKLPESVSR